MPRTWKFAIVEKGNAFNWTLTADGQTILESDETFDDETSTRAEINSIKRADVGKQKG